MIAVSLPIDYWDYLGWKDTLADPKFTARQKAYSKIRGDRQVYTPQVVVNGKLHALGSDRASIERAIGDSTGKSGVMSVSVKVSVGEGTDHGVAAGFIARPTAPAKSGFARLRNRCRSRSGAARIAARKSPTTTWCATG